MRAKGDTRIGKKLPKLKKSATTNGKKSPKWEKNAKVVKNDIVFAGATTKGCPKGRSMWEHRLGAAVIRDSNVK